MSTDKKIKPEKYFCKSDVLLRGWTEKLIKDFLPPPQLKRNPYGRSAPSMRTWPESVVENAENTDEFKAAFSKIKERREKKKSKEEAKKRVTRESVENLIPDNPVDEYPKARALNRKFILHIGPTNSGKTHDSLERLKHASKGAYLGPLRLLALEVFDRFNADSIPCSMVTGEEMIDVPNANIVASTIEMMNTSTHYDVVVIDEVQMIADRFRGHNWTKAILGMCADEIHLCMAPEAENIAVALIKECGDSYEIIRHQRATPLKFEYSNVSLANVKSGDALIVFSRQAVLSLAADLEAAGIMASVIYGNLPPASRREQVRKFTEGETQVVVSTDAIGMGINLPIRRIIFMETWKYDGERRRQLLPQEIKQIAGRAGRYGIYNEGYVLSVADKPYIEKALQQDMKPIKQAFIGFNQEIAALPYPLPEIAEAWQKIESPELYCKMDLTEMLELYFELVSRTKVVADCSREDVYRMITCSVDANNNFMVSLWLEYCTAHKKNEPLCFPSARSGQLRDLEDSYKRLDLYYQFSRRMGRECDMERIASSKAAIALAINDMLLQKKSKFRRRCRFCGKPLPYNHPHGICEECFEDSYGYGF